jgi:beta-hydroxylase
MADVLLSWKLWIPALWLGAAAFVHFRGRVRHRFQRQLTDHSTFAAPYNVLVYLASAVPRGPMFDRARFPELAVLREHWEVIRDEARALLDAGELRVSDDLEDLAFNTFFKRGWRRFHLRWYADFLPSARRLCPRTCELVARVPTIHAALFALLPPGGKLGAHRDPFGGSLRYHLGLITPNDDRCWIEVDGVRHSWRDGEDLLFDETFVHKARNDTERLRVILFCDVERPIRVPLVRALNRFVARRVARISQSRNRADEPIGLANRIAAPAHRAIEAMKARKKRSPRLYYLGKYLALAALAGAVLLL